MRVVVSINEFASYLKVCSLPHVHGAIDRAAETFRRDRCPHTLMRRLREIPEVSHECIVAYIRAAAVDVASGDVVEEYARVYDCDD